MECAAKFTILFICALNAYFVAFKLRVSFASYFRNDRKRRSLGRNGHARDQLLAQFIVDQVISRYPAQLETFFLGVVVPPDHFQLDLNAALVFQRQPVAGLAVRYFAAVVIVVGHDHLIRFGWDAVVNRSLYHLQYGHRLKLATSLGELQLKRTRVFVQHRRTRSGRRRG